MINIKSIWEDQKPAGNIIIKTRIEDIPHLNCFAATNHITRQYLYIMSVSMNVEIPELKKYRFKGVEIYSLPNEIEDTFELYIYLLDNELKDIFSLFIQNILEEVIKSVTENEALTITLNVISKWKKLFEKINFSGLTLEQQKGLMGELLFINYLFNNGKTPSSILNAWTGAGFEDKDFIFGSIGAEIKFTASKHPKIKITSERQLDAQSLRKLFLILYIAEDVKDNGFSLNSLVEQTRQFLLTNEERNFFNERLFLIGYFEDDREHYNKMYVLKKSFDFLVAEGFPKIQRCDLPLGVYDTSYSIELSALESFILKSDEILQHIE